ncbi:MAG: hypothetical protein CSA97_03425 [Bacteroidetes bacterium]|nr:MAG: hypothetical protein CSA97_03425 [Bacteroidota bacterium]
MNLTFNFIKSISNIYDEMTSNGFSLVYIGEFSHDITKVFTSMTETELTKKGEEKAISRKVFRVMVETLQNMSRHSDELSASKIGNGLFVIGRKDDIYYIITSNKVNHEHRANLESAIESVNQASPEELKQMYKEQMVNGELSQKGGAGLGLIDIRRKTGAPFEYQFLPLSQDCYFFILKTEINAQKIEKER